MNSQQRLQTDAQLRTMGRKELLALIPAIADAIKQNGLVHWWIEREVFDAFERNGLHVQQDHFYTTLPNLRQLESIDWNAPRYSLDEVNVDHAALEHRLAHIRELMPELAQEVARQEGYKWVNDFFPNLDAAAYYSFIRDSKPAKVLEIGSGFSSHVASMALKKNGSGVLECIEPYPTDVLGRLYGVNVIQSFVQQTPLEMFAALKPGDILFVDSSHVAKIGSDFLHILFQILPVVADGVHIHFHDIQLPWEYPREWVVERNWFWNEQYMLLAFLQHNARYRVEHMSLRALRECEDLAGLMQQHGAGPISGSSFWVKKQAAS